ncbi:MAG: gamma-glutamylcyclotransferase [Armatimonadetes bacterium]|nr:MAG: gamma-glutamylcyclotransferase [Armatimonadota bacterium]
MEKLFSYGTLQEEKVQKKIIGRSVSATKDTLRKYKLSEIEIENEIFPIIQPEKNSIVEGSILDLTQEELRKTDEYEGVDYKRIKVALESGIEAWVYVKNDSS